MATLILLEASSTPYSTVLNIVRTTMKLSGAVGWALQQLEIVVQAVARNRKHVKRKGLNIRDVERRFLIVQSGRKKDATLHHHDVQS